MYMNYLLWVSFFSLFIYGFGDNLRGPLFPEIIRTYSLSDADASWYFALASLISFGGSLFVRNVKAVSHLLVLVYAGIFCVFLGFAIQHFATHYLVVLIGAGFFGLSIGLLGMAQNSLVILGSNRGNRVRMLAFLHSMYGLASLMAPLYVAIMSRYPWQDIVFNFAWVALAFTLVSLYLHFKQKESIEHFSQFQDPPKSGLSHISELKISLAISLYVLAEIMISTRLALFMRRYFEYGLKDSSLYVTLFFICLLFGRLFASYATFSWSHKRWLVLSLLGSSLFILVGLFIHPMGFVISGFTMGPFYPLSMNYISHLFPAKTTTIVAWTLAVQSILIVTMHWGIGKLTDLVDLRYALLMGPVLLTMSVFILFFIREEKHA